MLTIVTPYQKSAARQRTQVYLWTLVNFLVFSILLSMFRVKNRGTFCLLRSSMHLLETNRVSLQTFILNYSSRARERTYLMVLF